MRDIVKKVWDFVVINIVNLYVILLLTLLVCGLFSNSTLKIIIWPSLIAVFLVSFKEQLSTLLNRIIGVKLPGGSEFQLQQEPRPTDNNTEDVLKKYMEIIKQKEAEIEEKQNEHEFTKEQFIQYIAKQDVIIEFERSFNLIFRTQLILLWKFQENKASGLPISHIEAYFAGVKTAQPDAFPNWSWQNYINFLIQNNLISMNSDGNFIITDYGSAFLEYTLSMNYQKFTLL